MGWQAGIWLQLACRSDLVRYNRDIDKYVPTWYYDHRKHDVPSAGMVTQVHLPYGRTAELRSATLRANPMTIL
jgi:hypothetical protein